MEKYEKLRSRREGVVEFLGLKITREFIMGYLKSLLFSDDSRVGVKAARLSFWGALTVAITTLFFNLISPVPKLTEEIMALKEKNAELLIQIQPYKGEALRRYPGEDDVNALKKLFKDISEFKNILQYQQIADLDCHGRKPGISVCFGGDPYCGAMNDMYKYENNTISVICSDENIKKCKELIDYDSTYPYSYYAMAYCLARKSDVNAIKYAENAKFIFEQIIPISKVKQFHQPFLDNINTLLHDLENFKNNK